MCLWLAAEELLQPQLCDLHLLTGCAAQLCVRRVGQPLLDGVKHLCCRLAAGTDDEDEAVLGLVGAVEGSKLLKHKGVGVAQRCRLLAVAEGAKRLIGKLGLQGVCVRGMGCVRGVCGNNV